MEKEFWAGFECDLSVVALTGFTPETLKKS